MYTIQRTFDFDVSSETGDKRFQQLKSKYSDLQQGPQGKSYLFCGDIGRGRTVRSLATVLARYPNQRMFFVSPSHDVLRLDPELKARLTKAGVSVFEFDSLDAKLDGEPILGQTDCLYMTRIQREHNSESVTREIEAIDLDPFRLSLERVSNLKEFTPIMHPFPRDSVVQEIPTVVDADPRVMYFRQARNGMWVRAALLVHLLDAADDLYRQYNSRFQ